MKCNKFALVLAWMFALAMPFSAFAAGGPTGNTTNEENKNESSSNIASTVANLITNNILVRSGGGSDSGQSSGDEPAGVGVWTLGGATFLDNTKTGAKYNGDLTVATVGVDKLFGSLLVGVGVGYEKLDLTTRYNTGKIAYDGFSLVPYLSYAISSDLIADASLIFAWLDYTMKDTQGGVRYSDTLNADRRVASAGLTKFLIFNKLMLSGRLGTMYMNEHQGSYVLKADRYSATGIYTWQGSAGLRGTYDMGAFKPFLGTNLQRDLMKSGASTNDNWGADFDLGFTYNLTDTFLLGLTGNYGLRENLTKAGGMLNLRYSF